jgi:NADH:ubiquinone oxidoreductase subunit E
MKKDEILAKHPPRLENVLLLLHDLQNNNPRNFLSARDLARVARYLNTTCSTIYGVASYYTMFSLKPRGKHIVRICRSPVCHMTGAIDLSTELRTILNIDIGGTTADGIFTLETTACLGQCDLAPVMVIDETLHTHLTTEKIKRAVGQYR